MNKKVKLDPKMLALAEKASKLFSKRTLNTSQEQKLKTKI
jgi:hypothetical protein